MHDALLTSLDATLDKVKEAHAAAKRGDGEAVNAAMVEAGRVGGRSDKAAKAYGFAVCGSESEFREP